MILREMKLYFSWIVSNVEILSQFWKVEKFKTQLLKLKVYCRVDLLGVF